jgi:tRNA (cytidine/uridine-2'-O-)-methyltransferase
VSLDPPLRIVLVTPEIPGNTGTIGRLAMATACPLHLVEPLGFSTEDRYLRRSGLDYWKQAEVYYHASFEALCTDLPAARFHLLSSHATRPHTRIPFRRGDCLVFGCETVGLPAALLERYADACFKIPMWNEARSLNLSVAVGVVTYEGLRQLGCLEAR